MKHSQTNAEERRFAEILGAARAQTPPPDPAFLRRLQAQSTQAFLAAGGRRPAAGRKTAMRTVKWLMPAAAACIAVVAVLLWPTSGPLVPSAYAQLAAAIDNTKAAEWVHFKSKHMGKEAEGWISVSPIRQAVKSADRIDYLDGSKLTHSIYTRADGTLRIEPLSPEARAALKKLGQKTFLGVMLAAFEDMKAKEGGKLTRRTEKVGGKTYTLFTLENKKREEIMTLRVDTATRRVVTMVGKGGTWKEPMKVDLDYPQTGPADIHALGVPRDAKLVDQIPAKDVHELDKKVRAARQGFAGTYYAILCKARVDTDGGKQRLVPVSLNVVYKKGAGHRVEHYAAHALPGNVSIADMKALEAWTRGQALGAVQFITGPRQAITVQPGKNGEPVRRRERGLTSGSTVEGLSWGPPGFTTVGATISTAKDPAGNELLVREHCRQGKPIVRQHYDPHRDYLRMRCESLSGEDSTQTIEECGQTSEGQWYAKKVLSQYQGSDGQRWSFVTLIHLDTTREVPEELLDPAEVKPESFLPREPASRQSQLPAAAPPEHPSQPSGGSTAAKHATTPIT